ncbi:hypothetical protein L2E82_16768 [Cichorium intybus]|uniref:Uncharacterized protein n=1 Tax=Cichorium intybus TaxID=13427 RepID=A0ACB9F7F1_CICIN|nr:hypothetical protein L2E82_16768 [Cichorium intybus]
MPIRPDSEEEVSGVAVKKLEPYEIGSPEAQSKSVKRRIQRELEKILASLRYRLLMSLRAYVCESDRFCFIYDYVPTGSLEDAMKRARENQLRGYELQWALSKGFSIFSLLVHLQSCNIKRQIGDSRRRISNCPWLPAR